VERDGERGWELNGGLPQVKQLPQVSSTYYSHRDIEWGLLVNLVEVVGNCQKTPKNGQIQPLRTPKFQICLFQIL
jgi:hypothetical protein